MPPKRFLVYFGEAIDKAKVRKMCELMELTTEETTLLLCRFCDGLTVVQVADLHGISEDRQRKLVPRLEEKVKNWIADNLGFFRYLQIRSLSRWVPPDSLPSSE